MSKYVKCNLCDNDNTRLLYNIDGINIVKCNECGLIYNNPQKEEKDLKDIYSEEYFKTKDYDNFGYSDYIANEKNLVKTSKIRLKFIQKFIEKGRLLDIGCAAGFFLDVARKGGWQTIGLEISPFAASYARERFGLHIVNDALRNAHFSDESFNVVTMWGLVQELSSPYNDFVETRRILKKGGYLFIQTSDISNLHARLSRSKWIEFKPKTTTTYFSTKTIKNMLEKAGFKVVSISRRGAGQYASLKFILERLATYNFILEKISKFFISVLKNKDISFYVNSMDSMLICAMKDKK